MELADWHEKGHVSPDDTDEVSMEHVRAWAAEIPRARHEWAEEQRLLDELSKKGGR